MKERNLKVELRFRLCYEYGTEAEFHFRCSCKTSRQLFFSTFDAMKGTRLILTQVVEKLAEMLQSTTGVLYTRFFRLFNSTKSF